MFFSMARKSKRSSLKGVGDVPVKLLPYAYHLVTSNDLHRQPQLKSLKGSASVVKCRKDGSRQTNRKASFKTAKANSVKVLSAPISPATSPTPWQQRQLIDSLAAQQMHSCQLAKVCSL